MQTDETLTRVLGILGSVLIAAGTFLPAFAAFGNSGTVSLWVVAPLWAGLVLATSVLSMVFFASPGGAARRAVAVVLLAVFLAIGFGTGYLALSSAKLSLLPDLAWLVVGIGWLLTVAAVFADPG
jgi:hypothetical protein